MIKPIGRGGLAIEGGAAWLPATGLAACAHEPSNADGGFGKPTDAVFTAEASAMPAFPVRVELGKPCLVRAVGKPVLIFGDAAWSFLASRNS